MSTCSSGSLSRMTAERFGLPGLPAGLPGLAQDFQQDFWTSVTRAAQSSPEQPWTQDSTQGLNPWEPPIIGNTWNYLRLWNTIINVINLKSCWSLMCCWYSETPLYPDSKLLDD